MDKKVYEAVYKRSEGCCEICFRWGGQLHHIVHGNGKRKQHESVETCIMLCIDCHNKAHSVGKFDKKLKLIAQERLFSAGLTEEEVRVRLGGKIYVSDENNNTW